MRIGTVLAFVAVFTLHGCNANILSGFFEKMEDCYNSVKTFLGSSTQEYRRKLTATKERFQTWKRETLDNDLFYKDGNPTDLGGELKTMTEGLGKGFAKFFQGIRDGDAKMGVQGFLMSAAPVAAFQGPYGKVLGGLLMGISSLMGMPGEKAPTGSDMLRTLLDDLRDQKLIELAKGILNEFQVIQFSTRDFRKQLSDDVGNQTVKSQIGDQLEILYGTNFIRGAALVPAIEKQINKNCINYPARHTHGRLHAWRDCFRFVNLYSKVSGLRQSVFLDLCSIAKEVGKTSIYKNMQAVLEGIQEEDRRLLGFLVNPYNHPDKRYVVGQFWSFYESYTPTSIYLDKLRENAELAKIHFVQNGVMICEDIILTKKCTMVETKTYDLDQGILGWQNFKSFFVPFKMQAYYIMADGKKITYPGPTVCTEEVKNANKFVIENYNDNSIESSVRICTNPARPMPHTSLSCEYLYGTGEANGIGNMKPVIGANPSYYQYDIPEGLKLVNGKMSYVGPMTTQWCKYLTPNTGQVEKTNQRAGQMIMLSSVGVPNEAFYHFPWILQLSPCTPNTETTQYKNLVEIEGCEKKFEAKYITIPQGFSVIGYSEKDLKGRQFIGYKGPLTWTSVGNTQWKSMEITGKCIH